MKKTIETWIINYIVSEKVGCSQKGGFRLRVPWY